MLPIPDEALKPCQIFAVGFKVRAGAAVFIEKLRFNNQQGTGIGTSLMH